MLSPATEVRGLYQEITEKGFLQTEVPLLVERTGPIGKDRTDVIAEVSRGIGNETGDEGVRKRSSRGRCVGRSGRLAEEDGGRGLRAAAEVARAGADTTAAWEIEDAIAASQHRCW